MKVHISKITATEWLMTEIEESTNHQILHHFPIFTSKEEAMKYANKFMESFSIDEKNI